MESAEQNGTVPFVMRTIEPVGQELEQNLEVRGLVHRGWFVRYFTILCQAVCPELLGPVTMPWTRGDLPRRGA